MSKKSYCVDVSVLLDNPNAVHILRNGVENDVYLTALTFNELDNFKKTPKLSHIVNEIIDNLYKDPIKLIPHYPNNSVLEDFLEYNDYNKEVHRPFIFVTNNKLMRLKAELLNITTEEFENSKPYESESQSYTGFVDEINKIENSFYWKDGKLFHYVNSSDKIIDYENSIWKLKPRTPYQNAAMELLLNPNLDMVTIQSSAGFGKSFLALAAALYWTLEKKAFNKIIVFKHTIDVGDERLGFLPGDLDDKINPYFRPIYDLVIKLHKTRIANKLFKDPNILQLDSSIIEFLPINFIRGMNIDNSFVIVDEVQNFSRSEIKVILSRMGEGTRVILLGDVEQIDPSYLNQYNNGLNWCVQAFKGLSNYAHIVLKGKFSRGKIADMVRNSIL